MQNFFKKVDKKIMVAIREIGREADRRGLRAFIVGGFVRDVILGRCNKDLDVVIEGDAVDFAQQIAQKKQFLVKAHKRFGTAVISGWNGMHIDCVSARKETYPHPGALPVVSKSSLKEDIFRRDFTINALAVSINQEDFGAMIDLCQGMKDLEGGLIRVFHDKSFLDDPTRILRAVRFEQRFGFRFDQKTRRLLKEAIACHAQKTVTPPRYFQEFSRGFSEDAPGRYLLRLKALGALDFLGKNILLEKKIVHFLDDQCMSGESLVSKDPMVVYMSVLYAGLEMDQLWERGTVFQWRRDQKKSIIKMVQMIQQKHGCGQGRSADYFQVFRDIVTQ